MVVGIILMIVSVFAFILIMSFVIPKVFLRVKYNTSIVLDRGIKRCIYNGKRCVVYERDRSHAKYISKYLLYQGEHGKVFVAKTTGTFSSINYDVVVYDRYDRVVETVNITEKLTEGDFLKPTELSDETAYVKLVIRAVDGKVVNDKPIASVKKGSVFVCGLMVFLLTALETFVLKVCCANVFGGVFREDFIRSAEGFIVGLVLAFVTGLVAVVCVLASFKNKKHG